MSIYRTAKERNAIRDFLFNKALKTNWESIELVNTEERDIKANPLTELSEKYKKDKNIFIGLVGLTTMVKKPLSCFETHDTR